MARYKVISVNKRRVYEHRFIMESKLGRLLLPSELVHHKDNNSLNNNIENLMLVSNVTHRKEHARKEKRPCLTCGDPEHVKQLCFSHYSKLINTKRRREKGIPIRKPRGICIIQNCGKYVNAQGLCHTHYSQKRRRLKRALA